MIVVCCLARAVLSAADQTPDSWVPEGAPNDAATYLRVFLEDGSSLVSYGEPALVGDRIVFSLPTSVAGADPQLQLVNLSAEYVDWDRTSRYAESARAARYLATHAETQYAQLTAELSRALNSVVLTSDAEDRLAVIEGAREMLAEWPANHFNYKQGEIQEMLGILDEALADLRAAAGIDEFDLSFVTSVENPDAQREELLPPPTPKEGIEQILMAARLSEASAERVSLMTAAMAAIERDAERLPSTWRTTTRRTTGAKIESERETDRQYRNLTTRIAALAERRAQDADVRGIERLVEESHARDQELGKARPEAMSSLLAALDVQLYTARRLQLERDRWALRLDEFQKYRETIANPLERVEDLQPALEDIKALAGSSPEELAGIRQTAAQVLEIISLVVPPEEFKAAHALLVSSVELARSAAEIRREAALNDNLTRAWDASSAAAGSMILTTRAKTEIDDLLRLPQLPR
jgi:hypothetical protein